MKLNLGSGFKKIEGFVNVDNDPLVNPDYIVDLEKGLLPFADNSIDEIIAHHILEHIGENFILFMQEIYRICKNDAIIDIIVPHHHHDVFFIDPTHKRPITVEGMKMFSKKVMDEQIKINNSSTGMAYKYNVDFDVVWFDYKYDIFYQPMIANYYNRKQNNQTSQQEDFEFIRLMREANNVAIETFIKLKVIKNYE